MKIPSKQNSLFQIRTRPFLFWLLLGFLFSCQEKEKLPLSPTTELLSESFLSWNGDSLPSYPMGKPKISLVKVTIPPHSELPHHYHPVINAGVLLTGELTVVDIMGNVLEMKAGDPIIEVVNTIHYGKNNGDKPAEILVFYAGVEGLEIVVKDTVYKE
jgi:quercetin dioxygenase-like cupin family protein